MTIAVASDAHGARRMMDAMLAQLPSIDAFCFLGDMDKDAEYLDWGLREYQPQAALYAVAGNNDPFSRRPGTVEVTFGQVKTMMTHGHLFRGIRSSRHALAAYAAKREVPLVLYGHTHHAADEEIDGVRLINPGALMHGHWMLLRISGTGVEVQRQQVEGVL